MGKEVGRLPPELMEWKEMVGVLEGQFGLEEHVLKLGCGDEIFPSGKTESRSGTITLAIARGHPLPPSMVDVGQDWSFPWRIMGLVHPTGPLLEAHRGSMQDHQIRFAQFSREVVEGLRSCAVGCYSPDDLSAWGLLHFLPLCVLCHDPDSGRRALRQTNFTKSYLDLGLLGGSVLRVLWAKVRAQEHRVLVDRISLP